ncbi:MAG TPA: M3 family metallopeptidase [Steroidobacteraceae bacterium]|nr:M3 family metallopeptidase [Steroidobacteraceae bacterium]
MAENPFSRPSTLPYQLPPFDRVSNADYRPAFDEGMREQRAEVQRIVDNPAPADFENTVVALERSGRMLSRVSSVFFNLNASNTDAQMQEIDSEIAPKLQAHEDAVFLDPALFARVDAVYQRRAQLQLDGESLQLLNRYYIEFVRAGARLADVDKARLSDINGELSSLTTQFKQNVLKATKSGAVIVDSAAQLDGLSAVQIGAAAAAAEARGLAGKWVIALQNTTNQPPLAQLKNRALRERIYRASEARGGGSDADSDNTTVIAKVVRLRAERAALLGYPNHAAYQLEDESAANPAAVHKILSELAPVALSRARLDAVDMQKLIDSETAANDTASFELQPWDWAFYSEKLRTARFDFDQAQVKPYFELEHVLRDGVFYAAQELYGLNFRERHDLPVYHPDVRVFEVFDSDGTPLALFVGDYFARDNKQGGAWMNNFVRQSKLFGLKPVVANNTNIPKPQPGQPTLLTFEEVITLFHEFGHAIHGIVSDVNYAMLSGTALPRDFVEYPSQYNEMWAREPAVLAHYARHYRTGAPMPQDLLAKVLAAQKFDQGYATTEYLAAALLDQSWHRITVEQAPGAVDVAKFEAAALEANGIDYPVIPPRYHSTYFSHVFAGGYSAGYYAYLWSEVLARDTGQWMHARGGLTRANGERLRQKVLSRGRTDDPQTMFRNFYGGPPDIGPLLEYRGLTAATSR